ncbi:uncharacterized protein LOC103052562 [Python bivittatus]|uniref:Uncharacterized protein LOC103052562 n=1 Tax=Python bivittatus TaxID=176946 RepID=A0A9F5JCN5_PYTBI|nr:uncharacterized protein LOC103052562 [Python bivittatus]
MATELRAGRAAFLSFQNVLGHGVTPTRKTEEEAQVRPLEADGERMVPRVIQVGTIGEFLGWMAPQELTQGPEEGLAQRWEAQWQEVLKAVQPLPSGYGAQHQSKAFPWDSCESVTDTSQWSNGEGVPQFLVVNNGEFPPRVLYGPEVGETRPMKDVVVEEEALLAEAQRQRFRQFGYQEAEGPQEFCKKLREFCCQWLKPEKHSKEQILELVILEQFLAVLPPEMQGWIRGRCPQACSQAVGLAEEFLRSQQQEIKVLEPCAAVVMISPEAEESLTGSGPNTHLCREAELKDGQDPNSVAGEQTMSGNTLGASQQGDPELPILFGSLMAQSGSLNSGDGLMQKNQMELVQKGEEAMLCSEGVYETVVRLEEHGHWCLECGESFQDALQLLNHQSTHSGRKRPECPECGKSFRDLSHVLRHQTVHTGEKPYACFKCGQSFTQKPALNRHLRKHIESQNDPGFITNIKPPRTDMGGRKRPECLACGKSFRDVSQVLRHQTVHTGERPYSCLECGQSFTQKPALNRHKRKHLRGEPYEGDQERPRNHENSRVDVAAPSRPWPPQTFPENRVGPFASSVGEWPLMNQHPEAASGAVQEGETARKTISRRGQKKYWCFICIKGFRDKADLVRHDRIHTGEKPYACLDCGRKFSYTSSLYKHQLIHRRPGSPEGKQFRGMSSDYSTDDFSAMHTASFGSLDGSRGWRNGVKLEGSEGKSHMGPYRARSPGPTPDLTCQLDQREDCWLPGPQVEQNQTPTQYEFCCGPNLGHLTDNMIDDAPGGWPLLLWLGQSQWNDASMSHPGKPTKCRRGSTWKRAETIALLEIWGEAKIQQELRFSHRNIDIFEKIAEELRGHGYHRSATECRTKTKTLRLEYKRVVAHNAKSGNAPVVCPFYPQLHRILQGDASMTPKRVVRSSAAEGMAVGQGPTAYTAPSPGSNLAREAELGAPRPAGLGDYLEQAPTELESSFCKKETRRDAPEGSEDEEEDMAAQLQDFDCAQQVPPSSAGGPRAIPGLATLSPASRLALLRMKKRRVPHIERMMERVMMHSERNQRELLRELAAERQCITAFIQELRDDAKGRLQMRQQIAALCEATQNSTRVLDRVLNGLAK